MKRRENVGTDQETSSHNRISASFKVGAIALAFLIIGYQAALFVRSAAVARLASHRDAPDTVFVVDEALARRLLADSPPAVTDGSSPEHHGRSTSEHHERSSSVNLSEAKDPAIPARSSANISGSARSRSSGKSSGSARGRSSGSGKSSGSSPDNSSGSPSVIIRRNASHSPETDAVLANSGRRRVESFTFDPNTVSLSDLQRLGFSERQAQSIINYREKGGRFRRPSDFAKSYVVADSVFQRLEPYIRIPKIDLNSADSTALVSLPGIGPYYAARIIEHRTRLRGFSYPEQLMDINRFDQEKYDALKDLVTVGPSEPYPLWTLPEDSLKLHPYIDGGAAHGIVLYREHTPRDRWTVAGLRAAGVLRPSDADRLARCRLSSP